MGDLIPGLGRPLGEGNDNSPILLPGKYLGQRSLAGYSLQGHKRAGHDRATEHTLYRLKFLLHSLFY